MTTAVRQLLDDPQGAAAGILDEGAKREIRRATLTAVCVPGYQVPFGSREMPVARGWGSGGLQVTLGVIGPGDVLKVIDQGDDGGVNATNLRRIVSATAGCAADTDTRDGDGHPDQAPRSRGGARRAAGGGVPGAGGRPLARRAEVLRGMRPDARRGRLLGDVGLAVRGHRPQRHHHHVDRLPGAGQRPVRDGDEPGAALGRARGCTRPTTSTCTARGGSGGSTRCRRTPP